MNKLNAPVVLLAVIVAGCAMLGTFPVYGQRATERYIPIGQSPGISGKYSHIGEIVSVDPEAHTIVVASDRGRKTLTVTQNTRIWLDRSNEKLTNISGSYADCEVGRRVEVMYLRDNEDVADWIKIETS